MNGNESKPGSSDNIAIFRTSADRGGRGQVTHLARGAATGGGVDDTAESIERALAQLVDGPTPSPAGTFEARR